MSTPAHEKRSQRRARLRRVRVYALLTEAACARPWLETARMLLEGGADALQLREKELPDDELCARGEQLRALADEFDALLIVNDRPNVALACGADGVHVGQDDVGAREAREIVGPDALVGLSTHTPEQSARAEALGADHVGVGPVHATRTRGYAEGGGGALVARLCAATALPTVAIGGLTAQNVGEAIAAGAQAAAACAFLCGADDPRRATEAFREAILRAREA